VNERSRFSRVHLPRRSPAAVPAGETNTHPDVVEAMADRLGSLPGIGICAVAAANSPPLISYYLDNAFTLGQPIDAPVLFATLDSMGRVSLNASPENFSEIVRKGWGEIDGDRIVTVPPRDAIDMTILWRIILMAYFLIAERREKDVWRENQLHTRFYGNGQAGSTEFAPGAYF
jgi:hypothetical protein